MTADMLFRLPDGLAVEPELTRQNGTACGRMPSTRSSNSIVFHGLRHSSATYQLLQSPTVTVKSVQGNTGHATAAVLMDTYAHIAGQVLSCWS